MNTVEVSVSRVYLHTRRQDSLRSTQSAPLSQKKQCPAASSEFASHVIGYRQPDSDEVSFFSQPVEIPRVLRDIYSDEEIESRFRMTGPCVKSLCPHWIDSCSLGHAVADVALEPNLQTPCSISADCRWFAENGSEVCGSCKNILNISMEG